MVLNEIYGLGLAAFIFVGIVYLVMGFFSQWIEGELDPDKPHEPVTDQGTGLLLIGLITIVLVVMSVYFIVEMVNQSTAAALGMVMGTDLIGLSLMLLIYRKYFIADDVVVDDIQDTTPW